MASFLQSEKPSHPMKTTSPVFSPAARAPAGGVYKGSPCPFCLPRECAAENDLPDPGGGVGVFRPQPGQVARWAKWQAEQPPVRFAGLRCQFSLSIR